MPASETDRDLVRRIRQGDESGWQECIDRYEGRLLAFARSRLNDHAVAEDIVQETFIGFLTSLPNYDETTPIEAWLFAIAANKIRDWLRRQGRRPVIPFPGTESSPPGSGLPAPARVASSIARSREHHTARDAVIAACLAELIRTWKTRGEWERLQCIELLFVRGRPNKEVAHRLGISEQQVANHKHFVVSKLKDAAHRARLLDFNLRELGLQSGGDPPEI